MGIKILHTADWHLDAAFASFSDDRRSVLRREQRKLPGKIAEICRQEGCDLVLLAGDVFDGKPSRDAVEAVRQGLKECGVPVFVSPGNHDFCGVGSPWLEEDWPENVTVFKGNLESAVIPELDCRVYGAGYQSMDCAGLLENFRAEGPEKYQIAVLHGDPVTARSPYCPITSAEIRASGLDYLALGHIHKGGSFHAGKTLCVWPGCPMGRGWDETGEKGVCITTLLETAETRFYPLNGIRFCDLEADVSGGAEFILDKMLPAADPENYYRVTLTGTVQTDVDALYRRYAGVNNLFFRDRTVPGEDLWEDVGADTFRGVYFRMLQDQAEADPSAVLAAELSRKILSGREVVLP